MYDNGLGGFTADGREYVIRLGMNSHCDLLRPPQPWCNVVANEKGGFLVSESGAGYTWAGNSRLNRLTAWRNDPLVTPAVAPHAPYTLDESALRAARAHARAVSNEMHAGFAVLRATMPMDLRRQWPLGDRMARVKGDIDRVTAIWRDCRERFGGGDGFLFGDFSIAVIVLFPIFCASFFPNLFEPVIGINSWERIAITATAARRMRSVRIPGRIS